MGTGLILGTIGSVIWISTYTAEGREKIPAHTATALFSVALMLLIAAIMFVIGSLA